MKPGPELDRLVAEKVMGWEFVEGTGDSTHHWEHSVNHFESQRKTGLLYAGQVPLTDAILADPSPPGNSREGGALPPWHWRKC